MDYDLAIKFYVLMLAMATAGTVVTFVSRKSYDLATCCYGIAMVFSMCFAMLDWCVPEKVGASSLSTTMDTYLMLVLMGMTFLCYKSDLRHKTDVKRRLDDAWEENLRQRKELLGGVGVVDIAEGDSIEILVEAKWLEKKINGFRTSGFIAKAVGTSIFEALRILSDCGIQLYDPKASDDWDISLIVYTTEHDFKGIYYLVGGVWGKGE